MDSFFSNIAVQTAALVGKAAFGAAGTLALKHVSEYITKIPKAESKKSDLIHLRVLLETKLNAIIPAMDLIDIMTARGNSTMKTILPLNHSLKKDIKKFVAKLEKLDDFATSASLPIAKSSNSNSSVLTIGKVKRINIPNCTSNVEVTSSYSSISDLESGSKSDSESGLNAGIQNRKKNIRKQYQTYSKFSSLKQPASSQSTLHHKKNTTASEYIEKVCDELKQLLKKIDQAVPLLNLALATSGINLGGSIPTEISTSRLLQASSFIYRSSIKYDSLIKDSIQGIVKPISTTKKSSPKLSNSSSKTFATHSRHKNRICLTKNNLKPSKPNPEKPSDIENILVAHAFNLKLYSLFSGSARTKSLNDFTWKEHYPRCQIKLVRNFADRNAKTRAYTKNKTNLVKTFTSKSSKINMASLHEKAYTDNIVYSYSLVCTENKNDGRYHEDLNFSEPINDFTFIPGKSISLNTKNIRNLYYSSSGSLLNIEGSNSPVLILQVNKENITKTTTKLSKTFEKLSLNSLNNEVNDFSSDDSSEDDEPLGSDGFSNDFDGFLWFALQVEDLIYDSPSDSQSNTNSSSSENVASASDYSSYSDGSYSDYSEPDFAPGSGNYSSNKQIPKTPINFRKSTLSPKSKQKHNLQTEYTPQKENQLESNNFYNKGSRVETVPQFSQLDWNQSSLSLLECLLRLAALEVSLQQSHLDVSDEKLHLFLADTNNSDSAQPISHTSNYYRNKVTWSSRKPHTPLYSRSNNSLSITNKIQLTLSKSGSSRTKSQNSLFTP